MSGPIGINVASETWRGTSPDMAFPGFHRCQICGTVHGTVGQAIRCQWENGERTPGFSDEEQEAVALGVGPRNVAMFPRLT